MYLTWKAHPSFDARLIIIHKHIPFTPWKHPHIHELPDSLLTLFALALDPSNVLDYVAFRESPPHLLRSSAETTMSLVIGPELTRPTDHLNATSLLLRPNTRPPVKVKLTH